MAISPAHKFGQIIGDVLEACVRPLLQDVADEFGLYLDYKLDRCKSILVVNLGILSKPFC